ncbi:hypothetical protein LIER_05950 [Lithospermum erythrorhizon]|uniref:F-box protein At3g26010-like beta-propeller domain-containing protein n=1 Tax=Lithospermum erythrorhizon TaxID=34254 RepID=A0AAV3P423_LITER
MNSIQTGPLCIGTFIGTSGSRWGLDPLHLQTLENAFNLNIRFNCPIETGILNFEVFASETGEWKSFDIFVGRMLELSRQRRPISLNGSLHWLLFGRNGILAYDPNNNPQGYRIIPLPNDNNEVDNTECFYQNFNFCAARGGCLNYIEVSESFNLKNESQHVISVWKLNDYDAGDWCLQHKVLSGDILADGLSSISPFIAIPVDIDPFCEDVLYLGCLNCVFSYNFQTRKLKAHGTPQLEEQDMYHRCHTMNFPCWRFVSLLAPIPTPTLIPLPSSNGGHNLLVSPAEEAQPNSEIM